jgi:hypothetical protein
MEIKIHGKKKTTRFSVDSWEKAVTLCCKYGKRTATEIICEDDEGEYSVLMVTPERNDPTLRRRLLTGSAA